MTDEQTGPRVDQPDPMSSDTRGSTPEVVEAVDESGASSGGGVLGGTASHASLHDVADEQADHPTPALDADGDGELAARLVDADGDGTADDAVINAPDTP
ncbi:hypothetical protein DEDE109153_10360 [Deinococcus deserti]|uniref:Uncharacterized protein n=1 Tax=Deinococcus deserti (strain DSM 17065 / CIP 109153 / LMG 22923 / VCD115) TaxID=546414 RepID=C1CZS7_DEIDV|nr:hypothetical protein [Deinococcus deserti]ACO45179.1 Hypothetical protein Deide_03570 [Deinococcus deserti VCD115]